MKGLLVLLLFAGCASVWTKPGAGVTDFRQDHYACNRDAAMLPRTPQAITQFTPGIPVYADPTLGWGDVLAQTRMFQACMEARGWTRN